MVARIRGGTRHSMYVRTCTGVSAEFHVLEMKDTHRPYMGWWRRGMSGLFLDTGTQLGSAAGLAAVIFRAWHPALESLCGYLGSRGTRGGKVMRRPK